MTNLLIFLGSTPPHLSPHLQTEHVELIIIPTNRYPPDTPEKSEALKKFFSTTGAPPKTAAKIPGVVKDVEKQYPTIKTWGIIGFCWGGKIVSLVNSTSDTAFKAGVECHPAMVDPADAEKITVPLCLLASRDEDAEAVKKFAANLKVPKYIETFSDQIHGFMAARADLEDARVKQEYERGYKTVLGFFAKHL